MLNKVRGILFAICWFGYIGVLGIIRGLCWSAGALILPAYDFFMYKETWKRYKKWLNTTFNFGAKQ